MEETKQPTEEYFEKLLAKFKANDPLFDQRLEFGKMLTKHVNSFTDEEKKRFLELQELLREKPLS